MYSIVRTLGIAAMCVSTVQWLYFGILFSTPLCARSVILKTFLALDMRESKVALCSSWTVVRALRFETCHCHTL